jgi:4-alpha-glucanotransferase
VRAFSRCFDVLAERAQQSGSVDRLVCEVLSTQPNELGAVLSSYGLGRFRVTQKANLRDESDVYRSENAEPHDWMLLGNHDTPPIRQVVQRWRQSGELDAQIAYLSRQLSNDTSGGLELAEELQHDESALIHAKLADLFTCKARNVIVSFSDLFGFEEPYNVPGTISDSNWTQRLPGDFQELYEQRRQAGHALHLVRALTFALRKVAPGSELLQASLQ